MKQLICIIQSDEHTTSKLLTISEAMNSHILKATVFRFTISVIIIIIISTILTLTSRTQIDCR